MAVDRNREETRFSGQMNLLVKVELRSSYSQTRFTLPPTETDASGYTTGAILSQLREQ